MAILPRSDDEESSEASVDVAKGPAEVAAMTQGNVGDFRAKFVRRLRDLKVIEPKEDRAPMHQTVTIFDWDDTLLCTSWLTAMRGGRWPNTSGHLDRIAELSQRMLEAAMNRGHTFIITNATTGWVEHSAAKWAPRLLPLLRKIPVISARDRWEYAFPQQVDKWKVQAFLEVQRKLPPVMVTNLIALGDSDFEMRAAQVMGGQFEHALLKTIKFRQTPSPSVLLRQLELVNLNLPRIMETTRNQRISLEKQPSA